MAEPETIAPKPLSRRVEKKRKRKAEEFIKTDKLDQAPPGAADGVNRRQHKKSKKDKKMPRENLSAQESRADIDDSIGKMDGRLLADHFVQRAQKLAKELSAVELSDLSVPGTYIHIG